MESKRFYSSAKERERERERECVCVREGEMLSGAVCYYLVINGEECAVCCWWEI